MCKDKCKDHRTQSCDAIVYYTIGSCVLKNMKTSGVCARSSNSKHRAILGRNCDVVQECITPCKLK